MIVYSTHFRMLTLVPSYKVDWMGIRLTNPEVTSVIQSGASKVLSKGTHNGSMRLNMNCSSGVDLADLEMKLDLGVRKRDAMTSLDPLGLRCLQIIWMTTFPS